MELELGDFSSPKSGVVFFMKMETRTVRWARMKETTDALPVGRLPKLCVRQVIAALLQL
jgi:hypothetical protein